MPDGGTFSISTKNTYLPSKSGNNEEFIMIILKDTGHGMNEHVKKHLFEPFFTTKEKGKGTGLGLASVFGTIQKHEGFIEVDSKLKNGAEFRIFFRTTPEPLSIEHSKKQMDFELSKQMSILFVDDEKFIRELAENFLGNETNLIIKENGLEALNYYKSNFADIDIVILDLIMPEMDGKETYRRMKTINPNIKIILISGYSVDKEVQLFSNNNKQIYLQKPFDRNELLQAIEQLNLSRSE